ncbi:hypothetical protein JAAARDRAFT_200991 [Jaapia argillacea MUCL 33604]|uniref:Uncharacterized protein n=1 Tax=Jaapia argillacea MUCL 33604 TaxID=933084 RepID=A0A067P2Y3_9AGAM|nr:hypothetical protein JAAARDRAFT_200991 [Jaapia argillacea MUCL 33604]
MPNDVAVLRTERHANGGLVSAFSEFESRNPLLNDTPEGYDVNYRLPQIFTLELLLRTIFLLKCFPFIFFVSGIVATNGRFSPKGRRYWKSGVFGWPEHRWATTTMSSRRERSLTLFLPFCYHHHPSSIISPCVKQRPMKRRSSSTSLHSSPIKQSRKPTQAQERKRERDNLERVTKALILRYAPAMPLVTSGGSHQYRVQLCLGKGQDAQNAGRWFQLCTTHRSLPCGRVAFITPPLAPLQLEHTLTHIYELASLGHPKYKRSLQLPAGLSLASSAVLNPHPASPRVPRLPAFGLPSPPPSSPVSDPAPSRFRPPSRISSTMCDSSPHPTINSNHSQSTLLRLLDSLPNEPIGATPAPSSPSQPSSSRRCAREHPTLGDVFVRDPVADALERDRFILMGTSEAEGVRRDESILDTLERDGFVLL